MFNQSTLDKSNYSATKLSHYYPFHWCFNTSAAITTSSFAVVCVGLCRGSLSEGGWLICPHRFEEEHSCFRLCVLLVLVAPGVRCGFVLLCVRLCACVFWGVKSLMVLVEGCDCGGFWVNRFSSGNQDCAWGLCTEFQDFSDAVFKFVYFYSIFAYDFSVKYTYFRLALSDSYSPSQLVSLIADFTITHVLPSQPPGTFLRASFWWNEINRFEFLFFSFHFQSKTENFFNDCETRQAKEVH